MNAAIVDANRRVLNSIDHWISREDYENSRHHYGCPPELLPLLSRPINSELICTDLLVFAAAQLQEPLNYLEIGVSVGKNFYAMSQALKHSLLVGLDWERINPTLAARLKLVQAQPPVSSYSDGHNMIRYIEGELENEASWRHMVGTRFNLVYSDASHHPDALLTEYEMLTRHGLLDPDRLFILWDDLDRDPQGPMSQAFSRICDGLKDMVDEHNAACYLLNVNGWMGEHEHQHTVGVFNTMGISRAMLLGGEAGTA
jgi:hypothetical protein